ncbi:hypothetical protein ACHQM5_021676 [Ranunculus cassubicifolius]
MPEQSTKMATGIKKKGVMLPAKRGKIKASIFEGVVKLVIKLASSAGERLATIGRGSSGTRRSESDSSTAPSSCYTSDGTIDG